MAILLRFLGIFGNFGTVVAILLRFLVVLGDIFGLFVIF